MPITSCKICKKNFYAKPSWLKKGHGKYCSRDCQYKAQKKGKFVKCHRCGKTIWRQPRSLVRSKIFFCTKDCMMKWRNKLQQGPNHPNWTGGEWRDYKKYYRKHRENYKNYYRKNRKDYIALLIKKGIKPSCQRCNRRNRRVLLIHHIDGNRGNNSISNLIFLCYNCHYLVHDYNESLS